MAVTPLNPPSLATPRGFSHATLGEGRLLFIAGQIGWNSRAELVGDRFADQFDQAVANILAVLESAGGTADMIARMTIYVTSRQAYLDAQKDVGHRYRTRMGRHYPAMTLVEVSSLLEPGALVEIEATAVLPHTPTS